MALTKRYCAGMSHGQIRRISIALLALVLTAGLVTHGVVSLSLIARPAMAVAKGMPMSGDMSGKCHGCAGDERGASPAACAACCGAVALFPATTVALYTVAAEQLTPIAERIEGGHSDPPDPYPPRLLLS